MRAEESSLRAAARKQARDSDGVSDEMVASCQRLLQLFGVPFITAPAEAEAQCAQLERAGLVDGIVTEDNDTFLFGGRRVYRRLFDQARDVELYLMDDVEAELKLGRNELIQLACLLGSDYTDGVRGVGVVNGVEVVRAFTPANGGLRAFARWVRAWRGGDEAAAAAADGDDTEELRRFKSSHKTARRNWELADGFPSDAVVEAYTRPVVDASDERCEWARPNLHALRSFCREKFGWDEAKADESLLPVMQRTTSRTRRRASTIFPSSDARHLLVVAPARRRRRRRRRAGARTARARRRRARRRRRGAAAAAAARRRRPAPKKPPKRAKKNGRAEARAPLYVLQQRRAREGEAENPEASSASSARSWARGGRRWTRRGSRTSRSRRDKAPQREKKAADGANAVTAAGEDSDSEDLPRKNFIQLHHFSGWRGAEGGGRTARVGARRAPPNRGPV